jgi:hypothetical protein
MGIYINPPNISKEEFLIINGTPIPPKAISFDSALNILGKLHVCLVDNGPFTAAAVAYCKDELSEFLIQDGRDKSWFLVHVDHLTPDVVHCDIRAMIAGKFEDY